MPLPPRPALAVAAALLAASPAAAQTSGSRDGFMAVQALTTNPQGFVKAWERPGPHADLPTQSSTVRGRPMSAFVIFKGCRPGADGACDVVAELSVIDPAGKASPPALFAVWPHKPPPPGAQFARSVAAPAVGFGSDDGFGRYTFVTTVRDKVAGTTVRLSTPLELRER